MRAAGDGVARQAGLTRAEVATRTGTAQPKVSRLKRLPVQEISQRRLRRCLRALEAGLVLRATMSTGDRLPLTAP
ncbi:XRE family transcriptional regulator [Streptomyces sp. OR43]|uniref:XRE family transcriptional regulator n=1 Tax=Streptomyces sp. or43 TaxID=2478957 RepID=UPI0011CD6C77|nr:XRE family transcriptional regulator [Streptomyces sp. or43]TXS36313.1 hypothetical protein EAO72_22630 [Streptomyces sp. or43]